jgi:hypothetical protein
MAITAPHMHSHFLAGKPDAAALRCNVHQLVSACRKHGAIFR